MSKQVIIPIDFRSYPKTLIFGTNNATDGVYYDFWDELYIIQESLLCSILL